MRYTENLVNIGAYRDALVMRDYYSKILYSGTVWQVQRILNFTILSQPDPNVAKAIYVRTAYRNDPGDKCGFNTKRCHQLHKSQDLIT